MHDIIPRVNGEAKIGYLVRTFFIKTRPTLQVLYQDILVQQCHGRSASVCILLGEVNKTRVTRKVRWAM